MARGHSGVIQETKPLAFLRIFTTFEMMTETMKITATEANRKFAQLLREVAKGKRITVTSHGNPVAVIAPPDDSDAARDQRMAALEVLKQRWANQPHVTVGPWTREELYERD